MNIGITSNGYHITQRMRQSPTGGTGFAEVVSASPAIAGQGQKTVPTAAAAALGASLSCRSVILISDDGSSINANSAVVWVGGAGVMANSGIPLRPGSSLVLPVDNVSDIYVISGTAGQKLSWLALE